MKYKDFNSQTFREMINRLQQAYNLFGLRFFQTYQISTLTYYEFQDLEIKEQVNYASYIFNQISNRISSIHKNLET